jgi:hypothetical protein
MAYVAEKFTLKERDRAVLEGWLRSPTLPQEWVLRAKIVLASAAGEGPRAMARRLEVAQHGLPVAPALSVGGAGRPQDARPFGSAA